MLALPCLPSQSYYLMPSHLPNARPRKMAGVFDRRMSIRMWSHQHSRKCGSMCYHESSRNSSRILHMWQRKASRRTSEARNQLHQCTRK